MGKIFYVIAMLLFTANVMAQSENTENSYLDTSLDFETRAEDSSNNTQLNQRVTIE